MAAVAARAGVPASLIAHAAAAARNWTRPSPSWNPWRTAAAQPAHFAPLRNTSILPFSPPGVARERLASAAVYGFPTGYTGPRLATWCDNHPSAYDAGLHEHLRDELRRNVALRYQIDVTDLYISDPSLPAIVSKLAIVPKSTPGKYRPIFDGSHRVAACINDYIEPSDFLPHPLCATAAHVRAAIAAARARAPAEPVHLIVADVRDAYRQLPIRPADWWQLTQVFDGRVYWHTCDPFGVRPAAAHLYAATLPVLGAIEAACGTRPLLYVDDSFAASPASLAPAVQLAFQQAFAAAGLELSPKVNTAPATMRKYIGFEWDTVANTQTLPAASMRRIRTMLDAHAGGSRILRSRLSSLLGVLTHAASGARHLGAFLSELNADLARGAGRWVHLSAAGRNDLRLWHTFFEHFSGRTLIELPPVSAVVYTDACTSWGWGWYAPTLGLYGRGRWPPELAHWHINALEKLCAIVALYHAHAAHGSAPGSHVLIRSDNTTTVSDIEAGRGRSGDLARLSRTLAFLLESLTSSLSFAPTQSSLHVKGVDNPVADALSRGLTPPEVANCLEVHTPPAWLLSTALSEPLWSPPPRGTTTPASATISPASSPPSPCPPPRQPRAPRPSRCSPSSSPMSTGDAWALLR